MNLNASVIYCFSLLDLSKQVSENNLERKSPGSSRLVELKHKMGGKVDGDVQMALAFKTSTEVTKVAKNLTIQPGAFYDCVVPQEVPPYGSHF